MKKTLFEKLYPRHPAQSIAYPDAKKSPKLVEFCSARGIDEPNFERFLNLHQHAKTNDHLPNVIIHGREIGYPGYFLVKLPCPDFHNYILGGQCFNYCITDEQYVLCDRHEFLNQDWR